MMASLHQRIERGRKAIAEAKAQGKDTTAWEKHLAELEALAEAEEIARRVTENGICLIWAETVHDFLAFVRDDFDRRKIPTGFVVYSNQELKELFGGGKRPTDETLRLVHLAKKEGGGKVITESGEDGETCVNT